MIASGRLRHRIRIERYVEQVGTDGDVLQDDATGQVQMAWEPVATVWAAIEPLSAREFIQSQAVQSSIGAKLVMRYRADIDASMRLVHVVNGVASTVYNPQGFLRDKDSGLEFMVVPCSILANQ